MKFLREGFVKSPWWLRAAMPYARWMEPQKNPTVYLTFDDGPVAGVTDRLLDILAEHRAHATFFCLGQAAEREPNLFQRILDADHQVGNHTYSHCNGWTTPTAQYIDDIRRGRTQLEQLGQRNVRLFRPPYGRLTLKQWIGIRHETEVCMWDVTTQDFLEYRSVDQVIDTATKNATNGSILLMHDSSLAAPRILSALPRILQSLTDRGFAFQRLSERK